MQRNALRSYLLLSLLLIGPGIANAQSSDSDTRSMSPSSPNMNTPSRFGSSSGAAGASMEMQANHPSPAECARLKSEQSGNPGDAVNQEFRAKMAQCHLLTDDGRAAPEH
ncbi:MAG: hypothetical protein JWR07_1637 [Nevskia sp.]|nr:hypothetical protein [Nevskia sp.]